MVDCNTAAVQLVGWSKSELIGMPERNLHPKEELIYDLSRHISLQRSGQGKVYEDKVLTKQGLVREVEIKASLIDIGGKKFMQGVFRDVTECNEKNKRFKLLTYQLNGVTSGECYLFESHEHCFKHTPT